MQFSFYNELLRGFPDYFSLHPKRQVRHIQKIQSCVKKSDICHEMNLTKPSVCTIWTKRKQIRVKWLAGDNFYICIKFYC
jgi:hypothetical protein